MFQCQVRFTVVGVWIMHETKWNDTIMRAFFVVSPHSASLLWCFLGLLWGKDWKCYLADILETKNRTKGLILSLTCSLWRCMWLCEMEIFNESMFHPAGVFIWLQTCLHFTSHLWKRTVNFNELQKENQHKEVWARLHHCWMQGQFISHHQVVEAKEWWEICATKDIVIFSHCWCWEVCEM